MPDIWSDEKRSEVMAHIRSKNTEPELLLRRALWVGGARYRIHDSSVRGTPDISHKGAKVAVFVDGCFWHGCPRHYRRPETRQEFWDHKLQENQGRRAKVLAALKKDGWLVFEFWECDVQDSPGSLAARISREIERRR